MKHRVVLMLTGCVAPNIKNDGLAVTDINTRKRQYLEAILWYAAKALNVGKVTRRWRYWSIYISTHCFARMLTC